MTALSIGVLESLFRRKGRATASTRIFSEFEDDVQRRITAEAQLRADEEPVVLSLRQYGWTLLTNQRTVFFVGSSHGSLEHADLAVVEPDLQKVKEGTLPSLSEVSALRLVTRGGEEILVDVEAGAPLNGVLNVLKRLAGS